MYHVLPEKSSLTFWLPITDMNYLTVKYVHISCVCLSGSLFVLRGIWMLCDPAKLKMLWVRVVPHCVDSVLLASALTLAVISGQYPIQQSWLSAKIVGLLIYIVLGMIALKRGRTKRVRVFALLAAIIVFVYIVEVAITRQVFPY